MMLKIREKYFKIFQLEGSQGYENRAVMGGLQALGKAWPAEAREQGVSESLIPLIGSLLNRYPVVEPENRRSILLEIGDLLSIPSIKTLPAYIPSEKPAVNEPNPTKPTSQAAKGAPSSRTADPQPEEQVVRSKVNTRLREIASQPMDDEAHGLEAPVSVIRGVGEKQGAHLVKLGVHKIKDLLYLFPRRYDDYSKLKTINQLQYGEEVTILARVVSVDAFQTKKGKRLVEAVVSDTTGALRLLWMNQDWHVRYLKDRKSVV